MRDHWSGVDGEQGDDGDERAWFFVNAGGDRVCGDGGDSVCGGERAAERSEHGIADEGGAERCDAGAVGDAW